NIVLQQIGYDGSKGTPWNYFFKISMGGIIITSLGFVRGYYITVLLIEKPGRRRIQIQGFLCAALPCTCFFACFCMSFYLILASLLSLITSCFCYPFLSSFWDTG
ncbi:hypothetical protein BDQ17DRAFT_1216701, partial [Cyathus striatus]